MSSFICLPLSAATTTLINFLIRFILIHGQVAEQLAHYVHVKGTVITEETFDDAEQFGTSAGRPHPEPGGATCLLAPSGRPPAPTGKRPSRTTTAPTWANTTPASQVGTRVKEEEAIDRQKTLHKAVALKKPTPCEEAVWGVSTVHIN